MKAPPYSYPDADFWTRPYLFGDLGREKLKEEGIDLSLTMYDEAVTNVSGGLKNNAAQAGQLWFNAKFDMAKLAGVQGGMFGLTLVDRFGQNLNTVSGIPASELTNEVFGRGDILRLTELYYSQKLFNDFLEFKGGRLPVGSDFFFGNCEFINLTFCGGQPGNIQGGYIYNWPVSQWGGVVHANVAKDVQFSVGVYDSNPNYISSDTGTVLGGLPSSTPVDGVLTPVELTWRPTFAGNLSGTWRLGGWYDSTSSIDGGLPGTTGFFTIFQDGSPITIDESDQRGRYGVYESVLQRLSAEGRGPQGWYTFLNSTFTDHRTAYNDYEISWGVKHTGTFSWRPEDEVGFAVGTTHTNSAALNPNAGGNEVPFEAWYGWQATGWLNLKFDLQYVVDPGGNGYILSPSSNMYVKTDNAWILGLRTTVKF